LNIKSFTNNINNINNKRNNHAKYAKPVLSSPELGARALASYQQLPGSTRKSRTELGSGQELDSGMHRWESGSGSQVEQQAGSPSEGSHGQREQDLCDPPALN